jgi:hypothetical protein
MRPRIRIEIGERKVITNKNGFYDSIREIMISVTRCSNIYIYYHKILVYNP